MECKGRLIIAHNRANHKSPFDPTEDAPDHFSFQPFFQRLMERLEALSRDFSDTPLRFDDP